MMTDIVICETELRDSDNIGIGSDRSHEAFHGFTHTDCLLIRHVLPITCGLLLQIFLRILL